VALTLLGTGAAATAEPATKGPGLRLVARASEPVVLQRQPGAWVWLELGTYLVAGRQPLEVWARRAGYDQPVLADQVVGSGPARHRERLPAGMVDSLRSFNAFTHVTVSDPGGHVVAEQDEPWCPAGSPPYAASSGLVRVDPDAPEASPYPPGCALHVFALGSVWGLPPGWGAPSTNPWYSQQVDLPDGDYTAEVEVNQRYRDLFGVPAGQASATVRFSVRTSPGAASAAAARAAGPPRGRPRPPRPGRQRPGGAGRGRCQPGAGRGAARCRAEPGCGPAGCRPGAGRGPARRPRHAGRGGWARGPLPAGPAAAARLGHLAGQQLRPELLSFAAAVWNAGTSRLDVQGTRRAGTDLMDAVQRFYDPQGHLVGSAPAGTLEWDPRPGHMHWHFSVFATYRLVGPDGTVVASQKQSFCLTNSDQIDTTIPAAAWHPPYGFEPACALGQEDAQAITERLDVGWGDTYVQDLPGQAIDVTGLANGTYQLEVIANPNGRLQETNTGNNTVRRQVELVGDPGARFAIAAPYQGIDV